MKKELECILGAFSVLWRIIRTGDFVIANRMLRLSASEARCQRMYSAIAKGYLEADKVLMGTSSSLYVLSQCLL